MWPEKQYAEPGLTLANALTRLDQHIGQLPAHLSLLTPNELQAHPPGKWSKQQIVGHLVDSALNNLRRFTEAQFSPLPYQIQSYAQDDLVRVNQYGQMPLTELLALWQALNRQILRVARAIPDETLTNSISFPDSERIETLSWLVEDYVAHLEHHLRQVGAAGTGY